MANITDKELLAICNLSNLKMEFANLKFIEPDTKILSNHTIYSLLEKEVEAIKNNNEGERVFLKKKEDNNQNESSSEEKGGRIPIYENIIDLKKKAGIVYEYCEKYSYDRNLII